MQRLAYEGKNCSAVCGFFWHSRSIDGHFDLRVYRTNKKREIARMGVGHRRNVPIQSAGCWCACSQMAGRQIMHLLSKDIDRHATLKCLHATTSTPAPQLQPHPQWPLRAACASLLATTPYAWLITNRYNDGERGALSLLQPPRHTDAHTSTFICAFFFLIAGKAGGLVWPAPYLLGFSITYGRSVVLLIYCAFNRAFLFVLISLEDADTAVMQLRKRCFFNIVC